MVPLCGGGAEEARRPSVPRLRASSRGSAPSRKVGAVCVLRGGKDGQDVGGNTASVEDPSQAQPEEFVALHHPAPLMVPFCPPACFSKAEEFNAGVADPVSSGSLILAT